MLSCRSCGCDLSTNHLLESTMWASIKNGSKAIDPSCKKCGIRINVRDVLAGISRESKIILISGTAGAGKTSIGQYIERAYGYILIDGDAVSYVINQRAKIDPQVQRDEYLCHREVIRTLLTTLGLGYTKVIVSYVIENNDLERYHRALEDHGLSYALRILIPNRSVCLDRDRKRSGWTAGSEYVDKWLLGFISMAATHPAICIDTSMENIEDTIEKHFAPLLEELK